MYFRDVKPGAVFIDVDGCLAKKFANKGGYGFFIDCERGKVEVTSWAEDYDVKVSDLTLEQAFGWAKSASWDNDWSVTTRKLIGALIWEWLGDNEEPLPVYKDFCGDLRRGEEVLLRCIGEIRSSSSDSIGTKTPINTYAEALKWAHDNCVEYGWSEETIRRVDSILAQWFGR